MNETLEFLVKHGYMVLFLSVFAQQIGLPFPSTPVLLAAGALARTGHLSFALAIVLAVVAALLADLAWYEIGRRRGVRVLHFLCRVSLEPDYCVRRTEDTFARHGARTLVVAKLVPGVSALATPLAGINGLPLRRFLAYDGAGILLWIGLFELLGYVFSDQLEVVAAYSLRLGSLLLVVLAAALALYIAWKYIQRQRFIRDLRIARITAAELKRMLDAGEDLFIVDLRHALDFEVAPEIIPGALRLNTEDLDRRSAEIPRDRSLVLYCT